MPKLKDLHPGGYIINSVSDRGLIFKHLVNQFQQQPAGSDSDMGAVLERVNAEGALPGDMALDVGNESVWKSGVPYKGAPVVIQAREHTIGFAGEGSNRLSIVIDEFNNVYLPAEFNGKKSEMLPTIQAAMEAAKQEDPSFTHVGANRRLPAAIEGSVTPAYFAKLLRERSGQDTALGQTADSALPEVPHLPSASLPRPGVLEGDLAVSGKPR